MIINHNSLQLVSDLKYFKEKIIQIFSAVKPSCLTEQKMIYGVSEKETAHISCTVDSNPKADSFFWTLNTTAGRISLIGKLHDSKNLPVIFAKRNLSLFIDILLFLAKLSEN